IDQDDRIALLGRNGEGKSTLSKLMAERLAPTAGTIFRSSKLRIGYFAQHQIDELEPTETPLDHLRRVLPTREPSKLRALLAGFGLMADQADTRVAQLSGGQRARLSLLLATLDAPHLLILDEPTNHLDMESREALVEALTSYSGAVILVSHDMHLLSMVADRLWLVEGGRVMPYDGDLESYRQSILGVRSRTAPPAKLKGQKLVADRANLASARAEVRRAEERIAKLEDMQRKLQDKLADPELYDEIRRTDLLIWQNKFAEVENAILRAEALWVDAQATLEALEP
ncbi:MAG: ATP-binding cassette domain-containing protein, partial [Pseudomonadota bacterium]